MIGIEGIQRFLPHRYPFLFVDRILSMEPGKSIVALKNVTVNEPFFQGHFPTRKVMPGVLMVEAIAQAGGVLLYHSIPEPESKFVVLSMIDKAKFKRMVVPGDRLQLEAEIVKLRSGFCHLRGRATVEGDLAVELDVMAALLNAATLDERS